MWSAGHIYEGIYVQVKENLQESILSLHLMDPGGKIQH